jgi:hypothetical protein
MAFTQTYLVRCPDCTSNDIKRKCITTVVARILLANCSDIRQFSYHLFMYPIGRYAQMSIMLNGGVHSAFEYEIQETSTLWAR